MLIFQALESARTVLDRAPFTLREIVPEEFTAGTEQEPRNENPRAGCATLSSAILTPEGTLTCQGKNLDYLQDTSLRVRNFNESGPVLSLPIRFSKGEASIRLNESKSHRFGEPPYVA